MRSPTRTPVPHPTPHTPPRLAPAAPPRPPPCSRAAADPYRVTWPGELALLYNSPRAATVLCEENGVLWALERKAFRYAMKQMGEEKGVTAAGFLKTVPLLAPLTDSQRSAVAHLMDELAYKDGEYVVEKVGCPLVRVGVRVGSRRSGPHSNPVLVRPSRGE